MPSFIFKLQRVDDRPLILVRTLESEADAVEYAHTLLKSWASHDRVEVLSDGETIALVRR